MADVAYNLTYSRSVAMVLTKAEGIAAAEKARDGAGWQASDKSAITSKAIVKFVFMVAVLLAHISMRAFKLARTVSLSCPFILWMIGSAGTTLSTHGSY
jgi:hypothetical protein